MPSRENPVDSEAGLNGPILDKTVGAHARTGRPMAPHQIMLVLVFVLTAVAYGGSLQYQFVYDDRPVFVDNPLVQSWRFAPGYFTHRAWRGTFVGASNNFYRPLFLLWLRTNHMIFGLRPWGWHLTNLLLHLAVCMGVYCLALRVVGDRLTAAIATAIFALHPVHIEAVVWICGVSELLLALFFIPAFISYLKMRESKTRAGAWLAISLLLYLAATLSKETAIVFPALVFAYQWVMWRPVQADGMSGLSRHRFREALRCASPYLVTTGVYILFRWLALGGFVHPVRPLARSTMVFTWPSVLLFYLRLLLWPAGLSPFYNMPYISKPGFLNFALPVAVMVAAATVLVWSWSHRDAAKGAALPWPSRLHTVTFAALWLLLPILPLLSLSLIPGDALAHDRYLYLPSVGFAMIGAVALRSIKLGTAQRSLAAQGATTAVIAVVFVIATVLESVVWSDDLLLYSRGVATVPSSSNIRTDLANVMAERGHDAVAIRLYQEVLSGDPGHLGANYNIGFLCYRLGRLDEAEKYLEQARRIDAKRPEVLLFLGLTELKKGNLDPAEAALRQAEALGPEFRGVHFARGMVLKLKGDWAGALQELEQELASDPAEQTVWQQIREVRAHLPASEFGRSPRPTR